MIEPTEAVAPCGSTFSNFTLDAKLEVGSAALYESQHSCDALPQNFAVEQTAGSHSLARGCSPWR